MWQFRGNASVTIFSFVLDVLQTLYRIRADIVFLNCVFRLSPSAFFIYDCNQSNVLFSTRTHQIHRDVSKDFETSGRLEKTAAGRFLHNSLQIVAEVTLKISKWVYTPWCSGMSGWRFAWNGPSQPGLLLAKHSFLLSNIRISCLSSWNLTSASEDGMLEALQVDCYSLTVVQMSAELKRRTIDGLADDLRGNESGICWPKTNGWSKMETE